MSSPSITVVISRNLRISSRRPSLRRARRRVRDHAIRGENGSEIGSGNVRIAVGPNPIFSANRFPLRFPPRLASRIGRASGIESETGSESGRTYPSEDVAIDPKCRGGSAKG